MSKMKVKDAFADAYRKRNSPTYGDEMTVTILEANYPNPLTEEELLDQLEFAIDLARDYKETDPNLSDLDRRLISIVKAIGTQTIDFEDPIKPSPVCQHS